MGDYRWMGIYLSCCVCVDKLTEHQHRNISIDHDRDLAAAVVSVMVITEMP